MKCPMCGSEIPSLSGFQTSQPRNFHAGEVSIQPGVSYIKREPARPATIESDVVVPTLQSIGSGIIAAIGAGTVAATAAWDRPALVGLAAGALCAGVVWAALVSDHHRLLWRVEEILGADIDHDGEVGAPAPTVQPPPVWIKASPTHYLKTRVPWADWAEGNLVAVAVLTRGVSFSRRALVDARAFPDNPEHYSEIYNAMRDADFLTASGKITPAGREYLSQFLPPPLKRKLDAVDAGIPTNQPGTNREQE